MTYETGSIRQIHQRLKAEGHQVSEGMIRAWVKQGILPASFSGKKAYIQYRNVLRLLEQGTSVITEPNPPAGGIRRVS